MLEKFADYRAYVSAYYVRYGTLVGVWNFCQWAIQARYFPSIKQ